MKNIILLISLACCFYSCTRNNKVKNSLVKFNLKGKVSSVKESEYIAVEKFGEAQKGSLFGKSTYKYDEKGNEIECNSYDSDGSLRTKSTYKYDEKGNEIECNSYDSDGSLRTKSTYNYDEKGNMIEDKWNSYDSDSSFTKATYKYDEKGKRIECNSYDSDGSLSLKATFNYDEKGNIIEINAYDSDGSLFSKSTYKYKFDKTGNWIEKVEIRNDKPTLLKERVVEYY